MKTEISIYRKLLYMLLVTICLALLITICLSGCEGNVREESTPYILEDGVRVRIVVIDSCEYIKVGSSTSTWGSHKGNCKFCTSRNKKQL